MNIRTLILPAIGLFLILSLPSFAANRFKDNGNGTVTDTKTGLMWQRDGKSAKPMNYFDAEEYCKNLRLGGYADWRLPTRFELEKLIEGGTKPYEKWLNSQGFINVQWSTYWAYPTLLVPQKTSWAMQMSSGHVYYYFMKDLWFSVLAVRSDK